MISPQESMPTIRAIILALPGNTPEGANGNHPPTR